jgi:hypothetical protein
VLTPVQQTILDAVGDLDITLIIPFIRKLRKKMMRSASESVNRMKHRIQCPECIKEFANTQGLSLLSYLLIPYPPSALTAC